MEGEVEWSRAWDRGRGNGISAECVYWFRVGASGVHFDMLLQLTRGVRRNGYHDVVRLDVTQ